MLLKTGSIDNNNNNFVFVIRGEHNVIKDLNDMK